MLETFSAASNFKSLLLQHGDMPVIQKFRAIIDRASKDRSRDTFAGILTTEYNGQVLPPLTPPERCGKHVVLSERALDVLSAKYQELFDCTIPLPTICHRKYPIGKVSLTTRAESRRDCNVFSHSTAGGFTAPGIIQYIVSIPSPPQTDKVDTFCIIERYAELPDTSSLNPFLSYEAFGAGLWSSKMSLALEAVPVDQIVCHAISRPWGKEAILLKALNRVSIPVSLCFRVAYTLQGLLVLCCCFISLRRS